MSTKQKFMVLLLAVLVFIFGIAGAYGIIEIVLHLDDSYYVSQCLLIVYYSPPILILAMVKRIQIVDISAFDEYKKTTKIVNGKLKTAKETEGGAFRTFKFFMLATFAAILIDAAATTFEKFMKFSVSPVECYFYYIAISIAEESCFRVFLIYSQLIIASLFTKDLRAAKVIATIDSAVIFAAIHYPVYGDPASSMYFPPMLYAAFALGIVFGIIMIYTRNPLTVVAAHVFIDAISKIVLLVA